MANGATRTFQTKDLATLLRTNPRRIEGWVEQGLLKPARRGRGPGRRHAFNFENLVQAALLLELQATFGEKSPAWRRLFPAVTAGLVPLSTRPDLPWNMILMVAHEEGQVEQVGILDADGESKITSFLTQELGKGRTVTAVHVGLVIKELQTRLHDGVLQR